MCRDINIYVYIYIERGVICITRGVLLTSNDLYKASYIQRVLIYICRERSNVYRDGIHNRGVLHAASDLYEALC